MKAIEKIIFNELSSHKTIVLPSVGTLSVERQPAVVSGKDKIQAPVNKVVFSPTETDGADSVIDIAQSLGVAATKAKKAYQDWLKSALRPKGLAIEGVGELKNGEFKPSIALKEILNPAFAGETNIPASNDSKKNESKLTVVLLVIVVVLLAIVGTLFICRKCACDRIADHKTRSVDTPVYGSLDALAPVPETAAAVGSTGTSSARPAGSSPMYYVVAGVFAVESNADKLLQKYKTDNPDIAAEKIPYKNNMTMVTIFSSDNMHTAYNRCLYYDAMHYSPELWVYERK